ncbi:hypothetical protein A9Q98_08145 [Thalassotalea sp. 42_200_T64]|nr:hypothetical protein A9Q98_08145 [Thalassotalea sp. 42_200_T64]
MMGFLLLFSAIMALIVGLSWVDKKYDLGLNLQADNLGLGSAEWFGVNTSQPKPSNYAELNTLKERVATLEAIVTDKKYQLDEKLRQL